LDNYLRVIISPNRKADENIPKRPQPEREERKENDPNRQQNNNWFNVLIFSKNILLKFIE